MTYRIVPCPKCDRLHGVVAVRVDRAQRSAAHLEPLSALGARERDVPGERPSGASERAPGLAVVTPVAANPMPVRSRQPEAPSPAGG